MRQATPGASLNWRAAGGNSLSNNEIAHGFTSELPVAPTLLSLESMLKFFGRAGSGNFLGSLGEERTCRGSVESANGQRKKGWRHKTFHATLAIVCK